MDFIKNDSHIKNEYKKNNKNLKKSICLGNAEFDEAYLDLLSEGPAPSDYPFNVERREITLETLKLGDIFPVHYTVNGQYLNVKYIADSPCELIVIKLTDMQEIIPVNDLLILGHSNIYENLCKAIPRGLKSKKILLL
jgi:hypothetical protein